MSRVFCFFGQPYVRQVFLTVLQITAICLSRRISENILGHLKYLIKEHLELFKIVFKVSSTLKYPPRVDRR